MNRVLFCITSLFCAISSFAQVWDGIPNDSVTINFGSAAVPGYSSATTLWQIGHPHKTFFGSPSDPNAIMTDTILAYPGSANQWFILKIRYSANMIIDFWHRYQTGSNGDGGMVEFSLDHGLTWQNVKGACNTDSTWWSLGIRTDNFYTFNDTLVTGDPVFKGITAGTRFSRFQFWDGPPIGPPSPGGSGGCTLWADTAYIRFRFISDAIPDTLAGWLIDSIKIERDFYPGAVKQIRQSALAVKPNPSYDGTFTFPRIDNEQKFKIMIFNAIGGKVMISSYKHLVDLRNYPAGLYLYEVTDGENYYAGRLLKE